MTRTTIDHGIDLGTTNSAIAVLKGTEAEIVKNNEQGDITPSAVYLDRSGRIHVGRRAKERIESHPDSTASEFKLRMGLQGQETRFSPSGRSMAPEELSAEVLKSLRADVRQRTGEDITAAVITVPAAFELNQTDATKRAANLAGLTFAPLIQEPTAAALAHGFQSEADNRFWLVYDLGGGTFDAAVVHLRDGELNVVNHEGDNFLGGKLIDWAIVEQLLIPALVADRPLAGFARGAPKWRAAIAKLKLAAEEAKISLSRQESAEVVIDFLCQDDRGEPVEVEMELQRRDVERLAEPFYARSLNICHQALSEARLDAGDIAKVVLVGGPTLAPHLRDALRAGLGIELDISQDPLTVVARGAAVFAGTQRLPHTMTSRPSGQYGIELDYNPIGADTEPLVGGRVVGADGAADLPAGLTVEFENAEARPAWRSGKVAISGKGTFVTSLWAEKGRRNEFSITLADGTGRPLDVVPDRLTYTYGTVETKPLLTHTVGVGLAGNRLLQLLPKGTPLPATKTHPLLTTTEVRPGSGTGLIRIPVLEGAHDRADRNRRVGTLEVHPTDVARDVPGGSEVEITLKIDASRLVTAQAYVPLLDLHVDEAIDLATVVVPDQVELQAIARDARARHDELQAKVQSNGDLQARALLADVEAEHLVDEVDALVDASATDTDAAATAAKRVGDLQAALDTVEAATRWPDLVKDAEQLIAAVRDLVDRVGDAADRRRLAQHESETRAAIASGDPHLLEQRCQDLQVMLLTILDRTGAVQVEHFEHLKSRRHEMTDIARAQRLITQGEAAIVNGNAAELRNVNRQLRMLLPDEPQGDPFSTVTEDNR